jgi:hypothetical protein
MTRRGIRNLLALFALAASVLVWILAPSPFLHGIIVGAVGALGLVLGVGLAFARSMMRKRLGADLKAPPLPVASWDFALNAEDLTGAAVPFGRYQGRVLVLNFWATRCASCLAEMPASPA